MNKKTFVLAALISVLLLAANAFALDFDEIYFTGSPGNLTPKDTFIYNVDQPWLFIRFDNTKALDYIIGKDTDSTMHWDTPTMGDGDLVQFWPANLTEVVNTNGIWMSFPTEADWRAVEELGDWTVNVETVVALSGFPPSSRTYEGNKGFTVALVPEPISCALFLLGGGALIFTRRLRKG